MLRCALATLLVIASSALLAQDKPDPKLDSFYKLGPDSMKQEGVPTGKVEGPFFIKTDIYPNTQRKYSVYIPAQYDPKKPAHLMIFQDGHAFLNPEGQVRATNVIDNLTFRREIPVMITVFINPGRTPDQPEPPDQGWGDGKTNRGVEYNTLDDRYARIICDELLPELKKKYNISDNPEHRGIGGASSGAIAAFTVAWERPDEFRKVLSIVGSFTNIRNGHTYKDVIKASEKKPLRVYFQDGRNDNRGIRQGKYDEKWDWFKQNVELVEVMTARGYDINYTWGIGLHGQKQGGAIFPDMMRWLWRDHAVSTDVHDKTERSFNVPGK
ncbi:Endo-1,4-beta-xylanase Z precursor [Caulifigura coniformis]|uniref:Endo-1,4-beta-xylanase Z n=1 Tax=Caulifigura coniformis TaxID=2527983 RepID=A0A517SB26_9PLAN|nr:alpha/beta hydrolase-fold protein [Caulifigura coniformis]QDT53328.1 Endo-1,4-beta-xylanase Z precursor [Caulifigura coniformis]